MCSGVDLRQAAAAGALDRERHERIPILRIVSVRAAAEVAPQVEVLELDPRAPSKLPVNNPRKTSARCCRSSSSSRMPGMTALMPPRGPRDSTDGMPRASGFPRAGARCICRAASSSSSSSARPSRATTSARMIRSVRPATGMPESASACADELRARAVHGAHPGAAGEHERAVDIEENEFPHVSVIDHRSTIARQEDLNEIVVDRFHRGHSPSLSLAASSSRRRRRRKPAAGRRAVAAARGDQGRRASAEAPTSPSAKRAPGGRRISRFR